ncbi:contactin-associated protein-like 2 isoform X2 [Oncorhynchus mykiss]|uniref:contactin-associated protein-like 2 isoform X2 n=1 Tax=Oncorhynchus mykiss TaxID=8022 RepID=UPI00187808DA|nr:contactin-associated protein-like 2 isoform X2 [Oncorhynchus mykiss]
MEAPTTAGTISPSSSGEAFSHMVSHIFGELFTQAPVAEVLTTTSAHMTETISDASVGVLTTTSVHMTETTSDAFLEVLTTTSAHMTETTSDAFIVGAAAVKGVSFEVLFAGGVIVVVLVVVLVLVLCHKGKHKGTYHTNEAD